jgi:glycogen synthase
LRLAFISYEYDGVATGGGIGTYVRNAAQMLHERGHRISVFTNGNIEGRAEGLGGTVYRVAGTRDNFSNAVLPLFSECHSADAFDVIESAEYGADGAAIAACRPEVARVVRLHTPTFVVRELNFQYLFLPRRIRFMLGSLRRGYWPKPFWQYDPSLDKERLHTLSADVITVPSEAMAERVKPAWDLPPQSIMRVANVFKPEPTLLRLSPETTFGSVTFVGRLEPRKGVIELAKAIPIVLKKVPNAKFCIVGRSSPHPNSGEQLELYMRRILGRCVSNVEFIEGVPHPQIPSLLANTDVCVFPSVWENFPYACLEAMSAARGVVGSRAGGMAEIIEHGRTGLLIPPRDHVAIAEAIIKLLTDSQLRMAMGRGAREKVLRDYDPDVIAPLQEACYARAIDLARRRNSLT